MEEEILGFYGDSGGVTLYTATEVVRLGPLFEQVKRVPVPAGIDLSKIEQPIFQRDLTHIAYYDKDGLFLCPLEGNAQPVMLLEHWEGENVAEYHSFYPLAFLDGERLYVAASVWEASAGFYLVLDYKGNELQRLNYHTSGEHSGGYHSFSPARAIYSGVDWRTYSFETGAEEGADWMSDSYQSNWNDLYVPGKPNQWVISIPDRDYNAKQSIFALADFDAKTLKPLPLIIHNAQAGVLAVAPSGHVLFVYSYRGEGGYGVFQLWQPGSVG